MADFLTLEDANHEIDRLMTAIRFLGQESAAAVGLAMKAAQEANARADGGIEDLIPTTIKDANWLLAALTPLVLPQPPPPGPPNQLVLLDTRYKVPSREAFDELVRRDWTFKRQYEADFLDCFAPETPVLCRIGGVVDVQEIQYLARLLLPVEVMGHDGQWKAVSRIWPKMTTKDILRITQEGSIAVTDDHRIKFEGAYSEAFSVENGKQQIDRFAVGEQLPNEEEISLELAWAFGLFFSDGHAAVRLSQQWHVDNYNVEFLQRCGVAFKEYTGFDMEIVSYPSNRAGVPRGGIIPRSDMHQLRIKARHPRVRDEQRKGFVFGARASFYGDSGLKRVPGQILRGSVSVKQAFLEGVWAGDGTKIIHQGPTKYITVHGAIGLTGLIGLVEAAGGEYRVSPEKRRVDTYTLGYRFGRSRNRAGKYRQPGSFVHRQRGQSLVYDLTCHGGEFVAANYLVHNCENYAFQFKANADWRFGVTTVGIVLDRPGEHAYNAVLTDDGVWRIFEPQMASYVNPSGIGPGLRYTLRNSVILI